MKIYHSIEEINNYNHQSVIVLGTFDGVHIAHKEVIKKAVMIAKEKNLKSVVYTFSNHPRSLFNIETPKRLLTPKEKIKEIEKLGVDVLVMKHFDQKELSTPAYEFLKNIIIGIFHAEDIVVGYDFRFGKNAIGCVKFLEEYEKEFSYKLHEVHQIKYDNFIISSTFIRELLKSGYLNMATKYLGRYFSLTGTIVHGKKIGRKLGFPTINLDIEYDMAVLKSGVYVTQAEIGGTLYNSLTNVGFNPTFDGDKYSVETYILDFDSDIYDETVSIYFLSYIREEIKFNNINDLINQIKDDVIYANEYFKKG